MSLWKKYLKDDGYIAVSEISWLTDTRPDEIEQYWLNAYTEIDIIQNKLSVIEKCGYTSVAYFALDDKCWTDNYYQPLLENSEAFLKKYDYSDEVKEFLEAGKIEADMYNRFKDYYSYVFYIAKKNRSSMPTTDEELQKTRLVRGMQIYTGHGIGFSLFQTSYSVLMLSSAVLFNKKLCPEFHAVCSAPSSVTSSISINSIRFIISR